MNRRECIVPGMQANLHDSNEVKGIVVKDSLLGIALSINWTVGPPETILHQLGAIDKGQEEGQGVAPPQSVPSSWQVRSPPRHG